MGLIPGTNPDDTEGSLEISFAGLFKLMCCTHEKPIDERQQLVRIAESLEKVSKRLDCIERQMDIPVSGRRISTHVAHAAASPRHKDTMSGLEEKSGEDEREHKNDDDDDDTSSTGKYNFRNSQKNVASRY